MIEEKYNSTPVDYIVSQIKRKLAASILGYPEFIFIFKILGAFIILTIAFTMFMRLMENIKVEKVINIL